MRLAPSSRVYAPARPGDPVTLGSFTDLVPPGHRAFNWASRAMLWQARADTAARLLRDPSQRLRRRWLDGVPHDALRIDRTDLAAPSITILGDSGEGDRSQYAVVPPLLAVAGDTDFLVIASDVIYPAGGAGEYEEKFYRPYRDYPAPIYAVPGNHDWYDGLSGFMVHLCGATDPDSGRRLPAAEIDRMRAYRDAPAQQSGQRGPYWVIDTGPLRLIGIDTGILGGLDREQGAWLASVAAERDVPKILVTGEPMYANGTFSPGRIEGAATTVAGIVHDPAHRFVLTLSGDVHNYQRYPVRTPAGRTVQHIVCGGAGAYINGTHDIPPVELPGVTEDDVRFYPLRGDSLAYFGVGFDRWATSARRGPEPALLAPDTAAAVIAARWGLTPVRPSARAIVPTARDLAAGQRAFPTTGYRGLNRFYAQYYDNDEPPFHQSFLRLDATASELRVRCFAATGRADQEAAPPVEDEVVIPLY